MIDSPSKDWSRHPLVVLILVLASCAGILTFLIDKTNLLSFFHSNRNSSESKNQDNAGQRPSASPSNATNQRDSQSTQQPSQLGSEGNQLRRQTSSPPSGQSTVPQTSGSPTIQRPVDNVGDNAAKPESVLPLPDSFEPIEVVNFYGHDGFFDVVVGKIGAYKCITKSQIIACYVLATQTYNANLDWSVDSGSNAKLIDNFNVEHEAVREYFTNARNQELKTFNLGKGDSVWIVIEFNNPSSFITSGRIILKSGTKSTSQIYIKVE